MAKSRSKRPKQKQRSSLLRSKPLLLIVAGAAIAALLLYLQASGLSLQQLRTQVEDGEQCKPAPDQITLTAEQVFEAIVEKERDKRGRFDQAASCNKAKAQVAELAKQAIRDQCQAIDPTERGLDLGCLGSDCQLDPNSKPACNIPTDEDTGAELPSAWLTPYKTISCIQVRCRPDGTDCRYTANNNLVT